MLHQVESDEVNETGAVFASVAIFQICYTCWVTIWSAQKRSLTSNITLAACGLFLVAALVLVALFAASRAKLLPESTAYPSFIAWKSCIVLAVNSLEVCAQNHSRPSN